VHTPRGASADLADESLQDMHGEISAPVAQLMKDNAILEKVGVSLTKWVVLTLQF
jgi:hypothetical protein